MYTIVVPIDKEQTENKCVEPVLVMFDGEPFSKLSQ